MSVVIDSVETMAGDLARAILEELNALQRTMAELGRIEVELVRERVEAKAFTLASQALNLARSEMADGSMMLPGVVERVAVAGEIKATIKMIGANRFVLCRHHGEPVNVLVSPENVDLIGNPPVPRVGQISDAERRAAEDQGELELRGADANGE